MIRRRNQGNEEEGKVHSSLEVNLRVLELRASRLADIDQGPFSNKRIRKNTWKRDKKGMKYRRRARGAV
jgi:hypothetical protein